MKKLTTTACALALGFAWAVAPVFAADEPVKDKLERAKDTTKEKTSEAWDKTKEKTGNAWDKTKEKPGEAWDKTKEKTGEAKDKAVELKDKAKEKLTGKSGNDDIRTAQQILQDKGFNAGPIDGKMGPKTKAAVSDFQRKENLKVPGRLDGDTKTRLGMPSTGKVDTTTSAPAASPATEPAPKKQTN